MNAETLLYRQAHPSFAPNGQITSQVFTPFPKDEGNLSVDDGDQISAQDSYKQYTEVKKLESIGVWAVTKEESESEGVTPRPDPLPNFPEHSVIDFNPNPEKECRKIAKKLKKHAITRGCQYSPSN